MSGRGGPRATVDAKRRYAFPRSPLERVDGPEGRRKDEDEMSPRRSMPARARVEVPATRRVATGCARAGTWVPTPTGTIVPVPGHCRPNRRNCPVPDESKGCLGAPRLTRSARFPPVDRARGRGSRGQARGSARPLQRVFGVASRPLARARASLSRPEVGRGWAGRRTRSRTAPDSRNRGRIARARG